MVLQDRSDCFVSILSSGNTHCCVELRRTRGFRSIRKGDYFDFGDTPYGNSGLARIFVATSNYYVDDPDDEIGCINAEYEYNPEI